MAAIALFNPDAKTLHDPSRRCGHISPFVDHITIYSWASGNGSYARRVGKVCGTCARPPINLRVPKLTSVNEIMEMEDDG